jgi:NAD(P)-dependent dehydrogenase (short-subunit alcohol dehydrogenase family)
MPRDNLTGRTILITGANSGLGLDASKLLAQLNCSTIVVACRSFAKGEKAKEAILQSLSASHKQPPSVIVFELDLGSFSNVVAFSERCKDLPRLDAAILNAGVSLTEFSLTEGYETTITVNVISTFLLATLLVPTLRVSAKKYGITPTIAITGSAVHAWAKEKDLTTPADGQILRTLSDPDKTVMKGNARYFLSKLPVMLMVKYMAEILTKSAQEHPQEKPLVVINNVAPGFCNTELFRHQADLGSKLMVKAVGRESEHGARTLVHGAVAGKGSHGQYLSECQVKKYSPFVKSAEGDRTAKRIWQELSTIYEEVEPGCTKML